MLSPRRFWLIWWTAIGVSAGFLVFIWQSQQLSVRPTVFRQTAQGWRALPRLNDIQEVRISEGGFVWARTTRGLSRLAGDSWYDFTASDLGTRDASIPGGFALDHDDVWAATADAVVHFDGRIWTSFKDAVNASTPASRPVSIAAQEGQVWVVSEGGSLSHFDGSRWTIRKLMMPWYSSSTQPPQLAVTSNGTLWLAYQGLWRFDGQSWNHVQGASKWARLLGVTPAGEYNVGGTKIESGGNIWVRDQFALYAFNVYGSLWARYFPQDLGLADGARAYSIAGRPPGIALATSRGLTRFDGFRWHAEDPPPLGLRDVKSIATGPDLSLYGVAYPPLNVPGRFGFVVAALVCIIIAALYAVWWAEQTCRVPFSHRARPAPWAYALILVGVMVSFYQDAIGRYFHVTLPSQIRMLWQSVGLYFLWHAYDLARALLVEHQLRAARYQRALGLFTGPLRFPSAGLWRLLHAQVLFYSDRAKEAEPILRELAESMPQPGHKAMAQENLGRVLIALERYHEAEKAFQTVATLMPARSTAPNGLAELRLSQGIEPEAAIEYAEQALRLYKASRLERRTAKERLAAIRGNQACALALLGRSDEAQATIKAARAALCPRHIPETAAFHWRAGITMLALGDYSAADTHFHESTRLDPRGYYGRLARSAHDLAHSRS